MRTTVIAGAIGAVLLLGQTAYTFKLQGDVKSLAARVQKNDEELSRLKQESERNKAAPPAARPGAQQQREEWLARQNEREAEFRKRAAQELGLSAEESEKLNSHLDEVQKGRMNLMESVRSGQMAPAEVSSELSKIRTGAMEKVKTLLGEERYQKFLELQRTQNVTRPMFGPGAARAAAAAAAASGATPSVPGATRGAPQSAPRPGAPQP